MRLLPKKQDIDKAKASERKIQIDEGVRLASKIDFLRDTALKEEKNLLEWRENNINKVKAEISQFIEERDNLEKQNNEARKLRDALLKPLDNEWVEINKEKLNLKQEKQNIYLLREQQKDEAKKIEEDKIKVREIVIKSKRNQDETEKEKSEAISLKEMAQREYEMAREEHNIQTSTAEKKLLELDQRKKEYEVALQTVEVREQEFEEKESDLLIREQALARRLKRIDIVEAIK